MDKLDRLDFALSAYRENHPCPPQANQVLVGLRKATANQCILLIGFIYDATEFARLFLQLLDLLETALVEESTLDRMTSISRKASELAEETSKHCESMASLKQDISSAVREITAVLKSDNHSEGNGLFTAENSQVVAEFIHAVDECDGLLQKSAKYYREMQEHFQDVDSAKSTPPTPQEIDTARQRWLGFSKSIADLATGLGAIRSRIRLGPPFQAGDVVPSTQDAPPPKPQAEPKAITDVPDASIPSGPSNPTSTAPAPKPNPLKSKLSFLRRPLSYVSTIFKRMFRSKST